MYNADIYENSFTNATAFWKLGVFLIAALFLALAACEDVINIDLDNVAIF